MKKKMMVTLIVILALVANITPAFADKETGFDNNGNATGLMEEKGFDEFGYNHTARIFSGLASGWCLERGSPADCMGIYSNDHLVMKWNAEWDRGNTEGWLNPPYNAWENNEWNGAFPGGSGAVWHYKIVWVGDCVLNPDLVPAGGYCVWGQFATIMDQGTDPSYGPGHLWFAHANPTGYGSYP